MAATLASQTNYIEKPFDSFIVRYMSLDLDDPRNVGTKSMAQIFCYNKEEVAGIINFYEHQPPVNFYRGAQVPHIHINFHISRFNDIINILRYQKPLSIWLDLNRLDGGLDGTVESIRQQE